MMFKDREQELRRLEQALLEQEEDEQLPEDDDSAWEDDLQWDGDRDYNAYNADTSDVNLEDYSEEVWSAKRSNAPLVILACCLAVAILVILVYLFLRFGGYL